VVEVAVVVEVETTAVEAATAPVKVVMEVKPSSGARTHSTQGAHSLRAPPGSRVAQTGARRPHVAQ
jgi:hypothetical protein